MLTHAMLYQCLIDAERRAANERLPAIVRERSADTVAMIGERLARENLTRAALRKLARKS